MESSWYSYPKIYNIGHAAVGLLFQDEVVVEEKVDGSQLSFGLIEGELRIRSRGREFNIHAADGMFEAAAQSILSLKDKLTPGWTYRGEYLQKPKHNILAYDRIPDGHVILFDIGEGPGRWLPPTAKRLEAKRLGLECVPVLYEGKVNSSCDLLKFMSRTSVLGGQLIEGVVVKNYHRFDEATAKTLMGKYVSEKFKEIKDPEWKKNNPNAGDVLVQLINRYKTPARWQKALQHCKERGEINGEPRDIAALIKELQTDLHNEIAEEMKEILYKWAKPKVFRAVSRGLPEWYKKQLVEKAFGE